MRGVSPLANLNMLKFNKVEPIAGGVRFNRNYRLTFH